MDDVQLRIFKSMFYGVVAAKRKINRPVYIKLGDGLFNVALNIYFSYGFDKLPYDIRPVMTNIGSIVDGMSKVYYIADTGMEAFVNYAHTEISSYPDVKDSDIFEEINGVSRGELEYKDEELAELVINKIYNDELIKDEACKNECKSCSCIKQKIKNDVERNLEGVTYG